MVIYCQSNVWFLNFLFIYLNQIYLSVSYLIIEYFKQLCRLCKIVFVVKFNNKKNFKILVNWFKYEFVQNFVVMFVCVCWEGVFSIFDLFLFCVRVVFYFFRVWFFELFLFGVYQYGLGTSWLFRIFSTLFGGEKYDNNQYNCIELIFNIVFIVKKYNV